MTAATATATAQPRATTRTGGPEEDGSKVFEHVLGWTLVVVLAMLVTQIGLM